MYQNLNPALVRVVVKVTLSTICGTDIHILSGGYSVKPGLIIGHEFVGRIDSVAAGVTGIKPGDRVAVGAITPCGQFGAGLADIKIVSSLCPGGSERLKDIKEGYRIFGNKLDKVLKVAITPLTRLRILVQGE